MAGNKYMDVQSRIQRHLSRYYFNVFLDCTVSLWPLTSLSHKFLWSRTLEHPMLSTPWEKQNSRSVPRPTDLQDSSGWFLKGKLWLSPSDEKSNFRSIPLLFVILCFPVYSSLGRNSDSLRARPSGERILLGGEIFRTRLDWHWGPPSLLCNGYRFIPGGKAAGAWRWPHTTI